jgi:hypothetical protein
VQRQVRSDGDYGAEFLVLVSRCADWKRISLVLTDKAGVYVTVSAELGDLSKTLADHGVSLPWFLAALSLFAQSPAALPIDADASPPSPTSSLFVFRNWGPSWHPDFDFDFSAFTSR